ncbi:MAG: ribulose-phosphate 3-epimerase [Magnetococcus sp. WYHC-3]
MKIAPSLLSADFARLGEELHAVEQGGADYIHVDVMDGHFVPNLTMGPPVLACLRRATRLPLDVHLMIEPVDFLIPEFVRAGADILTVHAEATRHLDRSLNLVRECGARVGVSLNPATPLSVLDHVLHLVDLILIMTVNPGFGGQSFIVPMLHKIRATRERIQASGRPIELEVDGGVKPDNIQTIAAAGADVFVAGSAVFSQPDYATVIRELRHHARLGC